MVTFIGVPENPRLIYSSCLFIAVEYCWVFNTLCRYNYRVCSAPSHPCAEEFSLGKAPTMQESQAVSDELFSSFVAEECDKVELIFTKFVSLISSDPTIQTLLPLTPSGQLCNADGTCVDAANDEVFKLTSKGGKFEVEREVKPIETEALDPGLIFEQEPTQILDSLLPLYLNAAILRSLQESLASELAARMNAMQNASDNAKDLKKVRRTKSDGEVVIDSSTSGTPPV